MGKVYNETGRNQGQNNRTTLKMARLLTINLLHDVIFPDFVMSKFIIFNN